MGRGPGFLAALFALALLAAPAASAAQVRTEGPFVDLGAKADRPGDHYRYVSETDFVRTGDHPGRQVNRFVFDIEVMAVSEDRRILRYTLREAAIEDASQPGIQLVMNAWIGIPVDVETHPGYEPYRLLDWAGVRTRLFAALDKAPGLPAGTRGALSTAYDAYEPDSPVLARKVLGDLMALAGMQIPAVPKRRFDLPDESRPMPGGGTLESVASITTDDVDEARCELTFSRDTRRDAVGSPKPFGMRLKTTATMSSHDGWVLSLVETETLKTDAESSTQTLTIRREGAPPLCGEI